MTELQTKFFEELKYIQETCVSCSLCEQSKFETLEDLLNSVTYDVIYSIMEVIDGYSSNDLQLEIIDRNTNEPIRNPKDNFIELHDTCAKFLKNPKNVIMDLDYNELRIRKY